MGLSLLSSSMLGRKKYSYVAPTNPGFATLYQPDKYVIQIHETIGRYLIITIKYAGCTNYEGKKVLVFKDCTLEQLKKQRYIDPHFSDDSTFYSPIARFEPTPAGRKMARILCRALTRRGL